MVTKDEIFEYVMKSPENTNPGVLRSLLDGIDKEITSFNLCPFIINNPENAQYNIMSGYLVTVHDGNISQGYDGIDDTLYIIPEFDSRGNKYWIAVNIPARADGYNVTFNGEAITLNEGYYSIQYYSTDYPESITISITAK